MNNQRIKIQFVDFWPSFNPKLNLITNALQDVYKIDFVEHNPDLLCYSVFGNKHKTIEAKTKLEISGENSFPDFAECDYAISTVKVHVPGRTLYFPTGLNQLASPVYSYKELSDALFNRKFCCFIYSQDKVGLGAAMRKTFAQTLMQYKFVECPGKILHNIDAPELSERYVANWCTSKLDYMKQFKFVIAFENTDNIGYITEKLIHAYVSNTVPIYWGSTADISPFPKESMICAADYPTLDALIERVKEVDNDPQQYMAILRANPLYDNDFLVLSQKLLSKRTEFIRQAAESALRVKPEFQSRKSHSMWNADARPIERKLFSEIMPKAYCISGNADEIEDATPCELSQCRISSASEQALSTLAFNQEVMTASLQEIHRSQSKGEHSLNELKLFVMDEQAETNKKINYYIAKDIQSLKLGLVIIRLSCISFYLRTKKLFCIGEKRKNIRKSISEIRSKLRICKTLHKELQKEK